MIDALPSLKAATGISGNDVLTYLTGDGWTARPSKVDGIVVVSKEIVETEDRAELILPIEPGHSDEQRRVADALRMLAQIEGRSEQQVADNVKQATGPKKFGELTLMALKTAYAANARRDEIADKGQEKVDLAVNIFIEIIAQQLRSFLGIHDRSVFNIVEFLEKDLPRVLTNFRIKVARDKATNVYSTSMPPCIFVEEKFYDLARFGNIQARLTLAHELGHLMLHGGSKYSYHEGWYYLPYVDEDRLDKANSPQTAESDARRFALALLMPISVARGFKDPKSLSVFCQVDERAAEMRMRDVALTEKALSRRVINLRMPEV